MNLIVDLLQQMAVFLMIAYLFTKTPMFRSLAGEQLARREKVVLYVTFSFFSILGTHFGLPIHDAIANTRAIGAVLAGLLGGPLLGSAVGMTGGLHRYFLGGFTAFSCAISTLSEGLIGGLVHHYLMRSGRSRLVFSPMVAGLVTMVCEIVQMTIIMLFSHPMTEAWALVKVIALPMILANSLGSALFVSIIRDQRGMYDKFGSLFSGRTLNIAEKSLGFLAEGLTVRSAQAIALIIHRETGVGAVGITDCQEMLAFVGIGSDHHRAGMPINADLAGRAIRENRTVFTESGQMMFKCPISKECPLGQTLWVPLRIDQEVIGTIILFEPKHKPFLNSNRILGEGIAQLLSEQLLRNRYEQQKSLLARSELKLVQAQINPHFLFNALNTIIAVSRQHPEQARDLLLHLSKFFRKNLKRSGEWASLEEELDHVNSYLLIEKARFGERLQIENRIDPSLVHLKIPAFSLQPLVENAIKHGISKRFEGGTIILHARQEGDEAVIMVEDNAGCYHIPEESSGMGMQLVDKRIRNFYGGRYGLHAACERGKWTRVTLKVPVQGRTE